MTPDIKLKVAEALQDDVNRGVVRLDSAVMRQIGVSAGEPVGIRGERETVAIVDRAYPSDLGLGILRMDGVIRKNAKIGVGEQVSVFKPELKEAQKVSLAPLQEFEPHPATLVSIKKGLMKKPVVSGDIITLGSSSAEKRGMNISSNNPFAIDLFSAIGGEDFFGFNLGAVKFKVTSAKPLNGFLVITSNTVIEISSKPDGEEHEGISYEDIGGLKSQLDKVRELVELPLRHPELFVRLGVDAPKGILLYGPPGTGKTLLARAIANETEASFYSINAPEIINKFYGESEKKLRELFEKAQKDSPAIIFIDEIDAIAQKREEVQGETEKRIVAQLLTLMDGLNKNKKVIVIAATNRPDSLDEALRRPGRFDRELEIGVPKESDRLEILKIHTRGMPMELPEGFKKYQRALETYMSNSDKKVDLDTISKAFENDKFEGVALMPQEIVEKVRRSEANQILKMISGVTHGFVGADLEALVKEAAFNVVRRTFPDLNLKEDEEIPAEVLARLEITKDDFAQSLKNIRPSAMREFSVESPNVKWEDIGGLENLKQQLTEMIEWPLKNPQAFSRLGIVAPKGILLYGPPGTGKTLLAKAVATETACNFIYVKGPEVINKYVGESERAVRKIFQKARQNSPCILFFDEFDAIGATRMGGNTGKATDKIVTQILTEMDGLENLVNVKVIAATNRPGLIDPALLRPGRFDKLVLVDIPDERARMSILKIHVSRMPIEDGDMLVSHLAQKTEGYVGADLEALVREAGLIALRRNIKCEKVTKEDFDEALKVIRPSVNVELRKHYAEIENEMKNPKKEVTDNLSMSSYM